MIFYWSTIFIYILHQNRREHLLFFICNIEGKTIWNSEQDPRGLIILRKIKKSVYKWYLKKNQQDVEIERVKSEQCLLTYGMLACLKGLKEQGCNDSVTEAIDKIEKHINKQAHNQGEEELIRLEFHSQ